MECCKLPMPIIAQLIKRSSTNLPFMLDMDGLLRHIHTLWMFSACVKLYVRIARVY